MRWLLTGAQGLLGSDARAVLAARGAEVTALGRDGLDVTDAAAVDSAVAGHDVVLNCAAWTAVDAAEDHEDEAYAVNAAGPRLLARAAARHGARLVQVSTDYVFDGRAGSPYPENARTCPLSAYGRTKEAGERAVREELPGWHLVVRSAWVYGAHGGCFPRTIAAAARAHGGVDVVDDQTGQPTWARDLAGLVVRLVEAGAPAGTYHATASGETTWFGFAREVVAAAGLDPSCVRPVPSSQVVRRAPRPAYSVLGHAALRAAGVAPLGDWSARWRAASAEVLRGV